MWQMYVGNIVFCWDINIWNSYQPINPALLCIFNFLTLTTNVYTRSTFIYIFSFIAKEDKKLLRSPDEVRVKVPRGMVAMSRLEFVFECMDGCFTSTASHNPPMTQWSAGLKIHDPTTFLPAVRTHVLTPPLPAAVSYDRPRAQCGGCDSVSFLMATQEKKNKRCVSVRRVGFMRPVLAPGGPASSLICFYSTDPPTPGGHYRGPPSQAKLSRWPPAHVMLLVFQSNHCI